MYLVKFMLSPGNMFIFSVSEFWKKKYFHEGNFFPTAYAGRASFGISNVSS